MAGTTKRKAAREILVDRGVDEAANREDSRCARTVVLPEPLSPKNTTAWFSLRALIRDNIRSAISCASPIALPSMPPSGPTQARIICLLDKESAQQRYRRECPSASGGQRRVRRATDRDTAINTASKTRLFTICCTARSPTKRRSCAKPSCWVWIFPRRAP